MSEGQGTKLRGAGKKLGKKKKDRERKRKQRRKKGFREKENERTHAQYLKDKKDPEKYENRLRSNRKSARKNKKKRAESGARYYKNVTKPKIDSDDKLREKLQRRDKSEKRRQNKREAVALCSRTGKPECNSCGITDHDILTLHHKNGQGKKKLNSYKLDVWVINYVDKHAMYPEGIVTLCHNCHQARECEKRRKNRKKTNRELKSKLRRRHEQKKEALSICNPSGKLECYSCRVKNVDVLGLHHRYGRKKLNHQNMDAEQLYRWVLRYFDKYGKRPPGIVTLCHNCHQKLESRKHKKKKKQRRRKNFERKRF